MIRVCFFFFSFSKSVNLTRVFCFYFSCIVNNSLRRIDCSAKATVYSFAVHSWLNSWTTIECVCVCLRKTYIKYMCVYNFSCLFTIRVRYSVLRVLDAHSFKTRFLFYWENSMESNVSKWGLQWNVHAEYTVYCEHTNTTMQMALIQSHEWVEQSNLYQKAAAHIGMQFCCRCFVFGFIVVAVRLLFSILRLFDATLLLFVKRVLFSALFSFMYILSFLLYIFFLFSFGSKRLELFIFIWTHF